MPAKQYPPLTEEQRELVAANTGLLFLVVGRMANCPDGPNRDELFSAGCEGLIKAVMTYKPELGFAFSTYACRWISLFVKAERAPRRHPMAQLDEDIDVHDGSASPVESLAWVEEKLSRLEAVRAAAGRLPEKQRRVILGTLDGLSMRDIAAQMGLSQFSVYGLKKEGVRKLRRALVGAGRRRRATA
jgi:RNA polymerase sigma factor (sigma-70 family)